MRDVEWDLSNNYSCKHTYQMEDDDNSQVFFGCTIFRQNQYVEGNMVEEWPNRLEFFFWGGNHEEIHGLLQVVF